MISNRRRPFSPSRSPEPEYASRRHTRYSSDLQREALIEDQLRLCREAAASRGWTVVNEYADRATSGSSRFRPENSNC
jgi:DNA invertase Pin-like site-specific DNA recombinase